MANTDTLTRFAHTVHQNLNGAEIIGLCLTEHYQYNEGERYEHHYTVLAVQHCATYDSRDHYTVHKVGIHSGGQVGIVGSGAYWMENEAGARADFVARCKDAMLARTP